MMDYLQTEARNPASTDIDRLTPLELVRLMCAEDERVVPAVAAEAQNIARAIEVIADRLQKGGRLIYIGAGTSGRLGVLDATECPPTFSAPPGQVMGLIAGGNEALTRAVEGAEDHPEYAERDLQNINFTSADVLIGIATSGRTPYVQGGLRLGRSAGAFTIGLSCNPDSDLLPLVDLAITPVVGPEIVSGSTRLKAGTATKLVLNMLTTGAMVRLGKTYGNFMVDLRATNTKLLARTNRIVRQLTGLSADEADELLGRCGGELKTALVTQLAKTSPEDARSRLQEAKGQVRQALEGYVKASIPVKHADLVLGIDGGGTHTIALLARRQVGGDSIFGRGEAGPSNLHGVGPEKAFQALDEAVAQAFAQAGLTRGQVASACLGLAGSDRPDDRQLILDWASRVQLTDHVEVSSDGALLLAAGTPDGWGLAVVAGTGSIVVGQTRDGQSARGGGWGYLLGDEGGGYSLVMSAFRAIARAADGRTPATALRDRLLSRLGLTQAQDLVGFVHRGTWDRAALASLAPVVLETAESGDPVAVGIVDEEIRELAMTAVAVVWKLALDPKNIPLALAGGILLSSEYYRKRFLQKLNAVGVMPEPVTLVTEPARGAVRLALSQSH